MEYSQAKIHSESHDWQLALQGLRSVKVDREGNVELWTKWQSISVNGKRKKVEIVDIDFLRKPDTRMFIESAEFFFDYDSSSFFKLHEAQGKVCNLYALKLKLKPPVDIGHLLELLVVNSKIID